jgi:hypothetical protein
MMGDLDQEIRNLSEKTARTRYEFLKVELQTCWTALEMGVYEFSMGNAAVAEAEVACVEKGISVIHQFLPAASAAQQLEVEAGLAKLTTALASLKATLNPRRSGYQSE